MSGRRFERTGSSAVRNSSVATLVELSSGVKTKYERGEMTRVWYWEGESFWASVYPADFQVSISWQLQMREKSAHR